MKKTQKVLDSLQFIEKLNLNSDELDRLMSELDDMLVEKEKQEEMEQEYISELDEGDYERVARENVSAFTPNILI